jgi:hypothetical protein
MVAPARDLRGFTLSLGLGAQELLRYRRTRFQTARSLMPYLEASSGIVIPAM